MATLRNKRKLAAVTRGTQEEHPRNGQSQNTSVPRTNEEFITQVSEEIEGTVTKKLSQEYIRTESRILGVVSKIDEFLLNQQIRTHSGTVPETFRNTNVGNQGTTVYDSRSNPHPEAGIFRGQTTQNLGPNDCRDINSDTNDSSPNNHKTDRKSRTLYPPCETCGKTNHSTERCYVGANAANRPLPWKNKPREQDAHDSITGCAQATAQHIN